MHDMTHSNVWYDYFKYVTWLIQTCDEAIQICGITHPQIFGHLIHRVFFLVCVTWLVQMYDKTRSNVWQDSFKFMPWLMLIKFSYQIWLSFMCDMNHSYDSFMRDMTHVTHMRYSHMTHPYEIFSYDSFIWDITHMTHMRVTFDSFIWDIIHMTNMKVTYDSYEIWLIWISYEIWLIWISLIWLIHMRYLSNSHVTRLIHTCAMTHSYVWYDSFKCVKRLIHTGWQECIGCLKSQFSSRDRDFNLRLRLFCRKWPREIYLGTLK